MAKTTESTIETPDEIEQAPMDSKYRMIIVAARRSKQLQRGANPRVEMDMQKHKPTRIALEEVERGKVRFTIDKEED